MSAEPVKFILITLMESVLSLEKSGSPSFCPLCGENNLCGNLSPNNNAADCWCVDSAISFPDSLLKQVSDVAKNNACICKACALSHQLEGDNSTKQNNG